METGTKNRLFVILSSHRSGSSATAGMLHTLGIHMGDRVFKPSPTNPKGYFENIEFVRLNDKILRSLGAAWDNPPVRGNVECSNEIFNNISSFLNKEMKPAWGLKDPRMILTFDLWKPHLDRIKDVTYIFTWRPLEESVRSLASRDKREEQQARDILKRYYENLIHYRKQLEQENKDVFDVNFHKLLESPERIVRQINCRMGNDDAYNLDKVKGFLDKKLKHF
ncbi:sulfotransferase family protein [Bacillus sp. C1]